MSEYDDLVVRVLCGEWHPTLRQTWGVPPACDLDMGHEGPHVALHIDGVQSTVEWVTA